jgi:hypothetical protein
MERALEWQRSSFCADSACVEVADSGAGQVMIRNNQRLDEKPISFDKINWNEFLAAIRRGEFA